jgi:hypothetical protein
VKQRASLGDDIVFSHVVVSWKVQVYVWIMENMFFLQQQDGNQFNYEVLTAHSSITL